ncbi:MAG: sigma-70 family RNA polymerase sigma factor, partial [Planctomycetota bacterium]|nr:sigma-70 family RNA polymerase sigma factor [Planctomycetota bacterium]
LRPWLATVARNAARMLHRSEGSRRSRETELARDRQAIVQRSPEEWLEQLETQELLSRLVRELPAELAEVLRMHYFDGMALNAIANQLGVPAGTVRWRKKRALECLKERLDQTHGGDRQAWLSALAPLAVPRWRGGAQAAAGGAAASGFLAPWIAMSLTWKLTSLVLVAALIALPFVLPGESLSGENHAPLQAPAPADLVQEPDLGPMPPQGEFLESKVAQTGQRSPVQGPAPSADPVQPITRVRMRVVDFQGAPVAGATVNPRPSVDLQNSHGELLSMGSLEAALFASQMRRVTGSDGIAAWESDLLREDGVVDFRVEGPRLGIGELTAALEVGADVDLGDVMLSRSGGVEGRVQDADGRGLKTKRVALCPVTRDSDGQEVETELTLFSALDLRGTRSGRLGKYRMLGVPPGEYRMWTQDKGDGPFFCSQAFTVVEGLLSQRMDIRAVSESAQAEPASLRILGADGEPLASAFVVLKGEFMSSSGLVGKDGHWGTSQNLLRFAGARL